MLKLSNFRAGVTGDEIIHGLDLTLHTGSVHAIMGPNGSGKSTLAMSLMGHPGYQINSKSVFKINSKDAISMSPEERAKAGLFVSFQSPIEITGVSFLAFVRTAYKELHPLDKIKLSEFKKIVLQALKNVDLDASFMHRSVNEGFSGGERKRAEIAQLIVLKPKVAILDEIDSGLDIDSLKVVAGALSTCVKKGMTVLLITHYQRILQFLKPQYVHMLMDGRIKLSGTISLVRKLEKSGYAAI